MNDEINKRNEKRKKLDKILNGFYTPINRHEKNIVCECGGLTFGVVYNQKEAEIDLYCTSCNLLAHTRKVFYSPLENIQNDIIDLLKILYKDDKKEMITFVKVQLGSAKVQDCNNMDILGSAFDWLYEKFERECIIKQG